MPENVGELFEELICDVPALKVSEARAFSVVPNERGDELLKEIVDEPKLIVLVTIPPALKKLHVKLKFAVSKDPFATITNEEPLLKASAKAHSAPTPLTVMPEASVTPFVVMVLPPPVPDSVIAPV